MSDSFPVDNSTSYRSKTLEFLGTPIPHSKVGNKKGGHGNFCGQTSIEHHKGSKKRGEGLVRILSKS